MVPRRIPIAAGAFVGILGTTLGLYLLSIITDFASLPVRFLVLLISWGFFVFFPHCLAHLIVGTLSGIRFSHYTVGRSGITKLNLGALRPLGNIAFVLSIRIERNSLMKASRGGQAAMFYSGALASMILPFVPALFSIRWIPFDLTAILFAISFANLAFDLYYSPRVGDISRARKQVG